MVNHRIESQGSPKGPTVASDTIQCGPEFRHQLPHPSRTGTVEHALDHRRPDNNAIAGRCGLDRLFGRSHTDADEDRQVGQLLEPCGDDRCAGRQLGADTGHAE